MPWWMSVAGAVEIRDLVDAEYLASSGRTEEAAAWMLQHRDDDPASARILSAWLRTVGELGDQRHAALLTQVRRWSDAHPRAADAPVALALATALISVEREGWTAIYPEAGPWCDAAREVLSVAPADAHARYLVVREQLRVEGQCGGAEQPLEDAMRTLALSGDAGVGALAWWSVEDGVIDEGDVDRVRAALDDDPSRLGGYGKQAAPPAEDAGPGAAALRDLVLERARSVVAGDRPALVLEGIRVLGQAGLDDEARAARERLAKLDPGNDANRRALERASHPAPTAEDEVPAETVLDPATRLAALRSQAPPSDSWGAFTYWQARADAAEALGDAEEAHAALRHLPDRPERVRTALLTGHLGDAERVADRLVAWAREAPRYTLGDDDGRYATALADALDLRATVLATRRKTQEAADDLEQALALAPATPDRLVRMGLAYADLGRTSDALPLLGTALIELPADDARREPATTALREGLAALPGWTPTLDEYLDAVREQHDEPAPAKETEDRPYDDGRFATLELDLDGTNARLFDLEGPLVLDVWATWCGPCTQSLPHLAQLAREYDGRVTFVAASVDEERAVAEQYLERRGGATFHHGWLGGDGMQEVGVSGIPAMFVFDAEHRLVARLSGWGPGNTELEDAIEKALAE